MLHQLIGSYGFHGDTIDGIIESMNSQDDGIGKIWKSNEYILCIDREKLLITPQKEMDNLQKEKAFRLPEEGNYSFAGNTRIRIRRYPRTADFTPSKESHRITLDANQFLSTSGDYEKYFIEDGIRYHHILDPKTGYPVQNGLTSVTIVCDQGYLADGLSTACFVLGMDAAKSLLEKYGAEAVFVDEDKNVYVTSGLMDKFELMKDEYTVNEA